MSPCTSLACSHDDSFCPALTDTATAQPVIQEPTEALHLMSADALGLSNESTPADTTFVNSTASLLQHLLRDDTALDLNEPSLNGGMWANTLS